MNAQMLSSNERAARSAVFSRLLVYMVLHRFICSTVQQARVQTDSVPFDLDGSDIPVTLCNILSYTAHQGVGVATSQTFLGIELKRRGFKIKPAPK